MPLPKIPQILPHLFGFPWEKPAAGATPPPGGGIGNQPPPPRPGAAILQSGWYVNGQQSTGNDVSAGKDDNLEYWVLYRAPDPTQPIAWAETVTWKRTDGSQDQEQDSGQHDNSVQPFRHTLKAFDSNDANVLVTLVLSQGAWSATLNYTLTNTVAVTLINDLGEVLDSGFALPDGSMPSGNSLDGVDNNGPDFAYWIKFRAPDMHREITWQEGVTYFHVDGSTSDLYQKEGTQAASTQPFSRNVRSHGSNDAKEIIVVNLSQPGNGMSQFVTFVVNYAVFDPSDPGSIEDSGFYLPDGTTPSGNNLSGIDPNGPDFAYWIKFRAPQPDQDIVWQESVTYIHTDGSTGGPKLNSGSQAASTQPFSRNVRSHGSNDAKEIIVVNLSQPGTSMSLDVTFVVDYAPAW